MRVLVTGASGAVGSSLVPQLIAAGHQVVATTRDRQKFAQLQAMGGSPVVMDGLDPVGVAGVVAEVAPDAIVHEMTALSAAPNLRNFDRWFATTNKLRTLGTEYLLTAAESSGVRRFVAQSYTGWNNARSGGLVKTEADALDPDPVPAQRESMAAIHFLEDKVTMAPLDGIVVRYGNLYGPGASDAAVELLRKRMMPIVGSGAGVWSWIHVDDAASGTVAALERGRRGAIYNIVDDEPAPVSEFLPYLAHAVGAKPPFRVPVWLGRLAAGEVTVRWMTEARGASNAKAKRELGWRPSWPSWREGFVHGLQAKSAAGRRQEYAGAR